MAAPCAPANAEPRRDQFLLDQDTVRQVVHLSAGGLALRLHFSNAYGNAPLKVRSVHVALRRNGSDPTYATQVDPATDRSVSFRGSFETTIEPGSAVYSDKVDLPVAARTEIMVSFFVPGKVTAPAIHYTALQTSYVAHGDQSGDPKLRAAHETTLRLILTGVDVAPQTTPGAIVAIGSSTTDGSRSTPNANRRWTDDFFARLVSKRGNEAPAVLNAGIAGNRVLHDGRGIWGPVWGKSAATRFQRDVLSQSGVRWVVIFEGGNDIRQPGSGGIPLSESVTPQDLVVAYRVLAQMAHDHGLKVIVGTITPFEHASGDRAEDPAWEQTRLAFNQWVRHAKEIDGVADFDRAIRDPNHPARILPDFDSGDHLHPNDAGYKAMAESIDLSLFQ